MAKSGFKENLKKLFGLYKKNDEDFFENLTDMLIEGDIGAKTSFELVSQLEKEYRTSRTDDEHQILQALYDLMMPYVKTAVFNPPEDKVSVYLILGVNGVGKTTSAAKMAKYYQAQLKQSVVLAAADTYRAAAIEQLEIHGSRLNIRVVAHQHGSDPGAVIFDAAEAVRSRGGGLVIADSAGRLHNKENLVRELQKIDRIAQSRASEGCYKKILVLDATTGQNALRQAEVFNQAVGVDAAVLTKYDSTAKGGIVVSLGRELGIPAVFTCFGEGYDDISPFDSKSYLSGFLDIPV